MLSFLEPLQCLLVRNAPPVQKLNTTGTKSKMFSIRNRKETTHQIKKKIEHNQNYFPNIWNCTVYACQQLQRPWPTKTPSGASLTRFPPVITTHYNSLHGSLFALPLMHWPVRSLALQGAVDGLAGRAPLHGRRHILLGAPAEHAPPAIAAAVASARHCVHSSC